MKINNKTIIITLGIFLIIFGIHRAITSFLKENENNFCKDFDEEKIFFDKKRRDSLGLPILNKNDFDKTINKGQFLVTYRLKEKRSLPALVLLNYQCNSEKEIYTFEFDDYKILFRYGWDSSPSTFISLENKKTRKVTFPSEKEVYTLFKKHDLINLNSDYFYGKNFLKLINK